MAAHHDLFAPLLHYALERDATDILIQGDSVPVGKFLNNPALEPILIPGYITNDELRVAVESLIELPVAQMAVWRSNYGPFKMIILKQEDKIIVSFHYQPPEVPDTIGELLPANPDN